MQKQTVLLIGGIALVVVIGATGILGYSQGWLFAPDLSVEVTATWPDGRPLEHALIEALGHPRGETGVDGKLSFPLRGGIGEEVSVSAHLERPGMEFESWQDSFVVRRWSRSDPDSLRYTLKAVLKPKTVSTTVEVLSEDGPVRGASVAIGGKKVGATDSDGRLDVALGRSPSRTDVVSVEAGGFNSWSEKVRLESGETTYVNLEKIGAVSARVTAAYESLGQVVRLQGVEAAIGGRKAGRTDRNGRLRFSLPKRGTRITLQKEGYLPSPAERQVRMGQGSTFVMTLFPENAPTYRVVVLPTRDGSGGNDEVAAALPEIEDKLSDYLFSYGVFERVDSRAFQKAMRQANRTEESLLASGWSGTALAEMADVAVLSEAALDEDLVLSVQVVSISGKRLGAFAETHRVSRVRGLAEDVAEKILEIFPFEGHVASLEGGEILSTLGSGGERDVRRGQKVEIHRWSGSVPARSKLIARGRIQSVNREGSRIELEGRPGTVVVGDKVVLVPRAEEAAFSAALEMTVTAGADGSGVPLADVNVYRDGNWVGTTSREGRIRVPVASETWYEFLFVKGGITPHEEEILTENGTQKKTIVMPQTMAVLRIESEPTGSRVFVDEREVGRTPLETPVVMGFRHVRVESDNGWRPFDEVLELTSVEEDFTGSRRIVLKEDVLRKAEHLLESGWPDEAAELLGGVETDHPDYSAARNLLGGIYLDEKHDPDRAIEEFESVLARPENRKLVNKRFTVTFLNLGRAYFQRGTPEAYRKAIENLEVARDNKRFFPKDRHDMASHDTLYFLALSSHKLYNDEPDPELLYTTSKRWKDYFDFFPSSLRGEEEIQRAREGAEQFYEEIQHALGEQG